MKSARRWGRFQKMSIGLAFVAGCEVAVETEGDGSEESIRTYFAQHKAKAATLPATYEKQTGLQKQKVLTEWLMSTEYCGGAGDARNGDVPRDYRTFGCRLFQGMPQGQFDPIGGARFVWQLATGFLKADNLAVSFDRSNDEMPEGRLRVLHPIGSVVSVDLRVTGGNYTGVFAQGSAPVPAIARLSVAGLAPNFAPGMAVKYLIDGKPSVNSFAMFSLTGQTTPAGSTDYNYFRHGFTNIIEKPSSSFFTPLITAFTAVKSDPFELPVKHVASINADGTEVAPSNVREPLLVLYKPNPRLTAYFDAFANEDLTKDFRMILRQIPPGWELYTVWASPTRDAKDLVQIGTLTSKSYIASTSRGDEQIFFRHPR
jgi:hypothetical protein